MKRLNITGRKQAIRGKNPGAKLRFLTAAAVLGAAFSQAAPLVAYATPESAYSAETWEMLRDNKMEYGELSLLVQEYSPYYLNNAASYADTKSDKDVNEIRQSKLESADDLEGNADQMDSNADDLMDQLEELLANNPSGNVAGLASSYASLKASAATLKANSITTRQSAYTAYDDAETKAMSLQKTQTGLIVQTQSLFASYQLARIAIPGIENSIASAERKVVRTQTQIAAGTATASDLLNAQNSLKKLQSTLTTTKANVEATRLSLLLNTGWKAGDTPEIGDVPEPDVERIASMNPDVDAETAVNANISLKIDKKKFANMDSATVDYQNQQRTIATNEQTIRNTMKTQYQTILTNRTAVETAQMALDVQNKKLSAAQTKLQAGMITQNDLYEQENSTKSAETDLITAKVNLQQAIETYEWALKGYMSGV